MLIARLLERDYAVRTAGSGEEALAMLLEEPADLVLADQRMLGITGVELFAELRARDPDCVRILMTAYTDPEAMMAAINRGEVYRFIFKPWNPVDMRTEIRHALERRDLILHNRKILAELSRRNLELEHSLAELSEARGRLVRAEKLALVGRFSASFAHDIRNLLMTMSNLHVFANRHRDDPVLCEALADIEQASGDMTTMVEELGALARGETPRYRMLRARLCDVVSNVVRFAQGGAAFSACPIEIADEDPPACPMAPERIRRVVLNLLQNAAEALEGGGAIRVRMFAEAGEVCLSVSDGGAGIPKAQLERIFEPFFTTKEKGTGLGLDICRTIVAGHGGRLTVESEVGKGSTFTMRLPG